jgi:cytochrome c oxidase assembly factor CtaG
MRRLRPRIFSMLTDTTQTGRREDSAVPTLPARARYGPGIAAAILITSVLLPPVTAYARQYAYAQALQFLVFAVAGPALLVLGTPWRSRPPAWWPGRGGHPGGPGGRAAIRLVAFIALVISWQLPVMVNALARNPALVAAEMVTLLAAGTGVWLELVSTPAAPGQLPRPARAAMAAAAMWTIWVLAYLTGMSGASWFAAYHQGAPGSLSAVADQQIAVAILWAVPALCFLPVIYVMVIAWLGGTASSAGNERPAASSSTPAGWPRPPRGWRAPHTRP